MPTNYMLLSVTAQDAVGRRTEQNGLEKYRQQNSDKKRTRPSSEEDELKED